MFGAARLTAGRGFFLASKAHFIAAFTTSWPSHQLPSARADLDEAGLAGLFSEYGVVETARIIRNGRSLTSKVSLLAPSSNSSWPGTQ